MALTAGELLGIAGTLQDAVDRLARDPELWLARTHLAKVLREVEHTAGARGVRELRDATEGHAA